MADVNWVWGREIGLCRAVVGIDSGAKQTIRTQQYSHQVSSIQTDQVIHLGLVNVHKTKSGCLGRCGRCFEDEDKDAWFAYSMRLSLRRTSPISNAFYFSI